MVQKQTIAICDTVFNMYIHHGTKTNRQYAIHRISPKKTTANHFQILMFASNVVHVETKIKHQINDVRLT